MNLMQLPNEQNDKRQDPWMIWYINERKNPIKKTHES